jgi:pSer/pThr/pTyr-binding forkhead associated (FHA) protein
MLEIQLSVPGHMPHVLRLTTGQYTIGSGVIADIRLRHGSVAERHALLRIEESRALLMDLGAADSVRRNGVVVSRVAPVRRGDTFKIGECEVRIVNVQSDVAPPTAPDESQEPAVPTPAADPSERPTRVLPADLQPQLPALEGRPHEDHRA